MLTVCSLCVHCVFTVCSLCAHCVFTVCSLCAHCVFIVCSLCAHCVFTVCSLCAHCVFTVCSLCVHCVLTVCSLCVHCVFTVCSLCAHCVFTVCSLCVHCVFTVCSLCVHCVFTVCSLCVHCVFTVCSLCVHCVYSPDWKNRLIFIHSICFVRIVISQNKLNQKSDSRENLSPFFQCACPKYAINTPFLTCHLASFPALLTFRRHLPVTKADVLLTFCTYQVLYAKKVGGKNCRGNLLGGVLMATMRCAKRHARGHQHQRCRHGVGLLVDYLFCGYICDRE